MKVLIMPPMAIHKAAPKTDGLIEFKFGIGIDTYILQARDKLTAYSSIIYHFPDRIHEIVIFTPVEYSREDQWSFSLKMWSRIDLIFGGPGCFDKYLKTNPACIRQCIATIRQI